MNSHIGDDLSKMWILSMWYSSIWKARNRSVISFVKPLKDHCLDHKILQDPTYLNKNQPIREVGRLRVDPTVITNAEDPVVLSGASNKAKDFITFFDFVMALNDNVMDASLYTRT